MIPRPDTELLVEQGLKLAIARLVQLPSGSELAILDLGTGTGAIILALAFELQPIAKQKNKRLKLLGVDFKAEIIELAKRNAIRNGLDGIDFVCSHWFAQLAGQRFDLIVSNPPYIDPKDPHLQLGSAQYEPHSALVAEQQGYADLQHIIEQAPNYLNAQGWLLLEHGWQQAEGVSDLLAKQNWQDIKSFSDHGGHQRITVAQVTTAS